MTKQEKLLYAAKAIGLKITWAFVVDSNLLIVDNDESCVSEPLYPTYIDVDGFRCTWDPEHNGNDALNLAASLHMSISIGDASTKVSCRGKSFSAHHYASGYAHATRVAILEVAAQLGKSLANFKFMVFSLITSWPTHSTVLVVCSADKLNVAESMIKESNIPVGISHFDPSSPVTELRGKSYACVLVDSHVCVTNDLQVALERSLSRSSSANKVISPNSLIQRVRL